MSYLTHAEFLKRVEQSNSKYWQEGKGYRWQYISYAIDQAKKICPDDSKLIEAGTSGMSLSDVSFLYEYPKYDLNLIPFKTIEGIPIANGNIMERHTFMSENQFDLFIALQTWEHLDNQSRAFKEVMRISKSAILSFPFMWTWGDKRHKGITAKKIHQWTCGVKPESIKIINHRAIYVWRF